MDHRIALKKNTLLRLVNDKGEAIRVCRRNRSWVLVSYEASREPKQKIRPLPVKVFIPIN